MVGARVVWLDTLRWYGKEVRLGTGLRADDGKSKRMVSNAHDKAIDRWCSRSNIFRADWKPLCVGRDETISRLMPSPDADTAANGGTRTALRRTRHGHGAERKTWRKVAETREWAHLVLGWDRLGQHIVFDALKTGRMAAGQGDGVLHRSQTALASGEGQEDGGELASASTLCSGRQSDVMLLW